MDAFTIRSPLSPEKIVHKSASSSFPAEEIPPSSEWKCMFLSMDWFASDGVVGVARDCELPLLGLFGD